MIIIEKENIMFRKIRSIVHWEINILEEIKEYLIKQDEVNEEFRQELRKQKENSEDIRLRLIHIEDRLKIVDEDKIEDMRSRLIHIEDKVNVDENDSHSLAVRLLEIMDTKSGKDNSVIKPSRVNSPDIEFDSIYVNVYFDSTYYDMKPSTEVLYRAAVVKTLSQIDGVTYVRFYVDGKDAVYEDGTNIGNMSSEDFVDSSEGAISDVKWVNINLYYANRSGDALVKTNKKICYNKNVSLEKVVAEQIIDGPDQSGCYQSVPSSTKLLSISVKDKICYINLSSEFASDMVNAKSNVTLYSLVDSLTGLDGIDGVKILVNGNSNLMYRDVISLDSIFYMNNEIVEK